MKPNEKQKLQILCLLTINKVLWCNFFYLVNFISASLSLSSVLPVILSNIRSNISILDAYPIKLRPWCSLLTLPYVSDYLKIPLWLPSGFKKICPVL